MEANGGQMVPLLGTFKGRRDAAEWLTSLGLPTVPSRLAKLATSGNGPRFHRWGRMTVYAVADLESWARERLGSGGSATKSAA